MKELILKIAKALVDHPEKVSVAEVKGSQCTVYELTVDKSEVGKIIGKKGHTAQAIRTILSAASATAKKRTSLEIIETEGRTASTVERGYRR